MTGHFTPGQFPPALSPLDSSPPPDHSPMKSTHGNNVVWLCTKYAVDANLFRLAFQILTRVKRATKRNNVGGAGNIPWGNVPGWNVPRGSIPRTDFTLRLPHIMLLSVIFKLSFSFLLIFFTLFTLPSGSYCNFLLLSLLTSLPFVRLRHRPPP